MTGETPPRRTVKATETVFEIIEFLDADSLSGVTDIASALDLAPSTVHKHLTTLVAQEYVIKEDRQYRLGFRFYEQGQKVRRASPLADSGRPDRGTREHDWRSRLGVRRGTRVRCSSVESRRRPRCPDSR
ncbi:helix-turn-helix domain-containing protein [Halomicroarcula sp. GCM10025324]|uniref:helix-turn-helix domain-containing protein n=1 Tax=Halomicroarcula sp. GCM10025324 TaxID=3252667 RepID=UPI003622904F